MKNLYFKLFALLCGGVSLCQCSPSAAQNTATRVDTLLSILHNPLTDTVIVVAHRGEWRNSIENSIPSLESAIQMGVDVVELDVRRTADSQLILMHDATIDRTTNGSGAVAELTLDSIKRCFLRDRDSSISTLQVPTLQEAFAVCKDRILINIDKGYAIFDEIFALSEQCGVTRQLIMKGGYGAAKVVADFAPYKDKVIYMPIVNMDQAGAADSIQRFQSLLHPVAYELLFRSDSSTMPAWVAQTLQGESLIWYNVMWNHMAGERYDDMALTEPDRVYGYLVDSLGARLLQTDRPQLLIEYLKAKGRH